MGILFTVNIICFGTKYYASLEIIMSCQVLSYQPFHTKNYLRAPFKIHFFARFSLVSLSIHPRPRRGAESKARGVGAAPRKRRSNEAI